MPKVTYLFGAGASANCLPIVSQIPERLEDFHHFVVNHRTSLIEDIIKNVSITEIEEDFLHELEDIREKVKNHQSVDTYAKKLRIRAAISKDAEMKYVKLKAIISCFFIWEQLMKPVDNRYDAFFASILDESEVGFPKNLRIISWNYDFQFEKAYRAYSMKESLRDNQLALNIYPGPLPIDRWQDGFSIFKLNGTTGFYNKKDNHNAHLHDDFEIKDPYSLVKQFVIHYAFSYLSVTNKFVPLLSFAWENDWREETRQMIDAAQKAVHGSDVLVIIGYSIPFFNRKVDRQVSSSFMHSIKSVYIQDKNPESVKEKLSSIWLGPLPKHIELKDNTDQFFLPPEL